MKMTERKFRAVIAAMHEPGTFFQGIAAAAKAAVTHEKVLGEWLAAHDRAWTQCEDLKECLDKIRKVAKAAMKGKSAPLKGKNTPHGTGCNMCRWRRRQRRRAQAAARAAARRMT